MLLFHCPDCGHAAKVIETRLTSNGTRRRRLACQAPDCARRWTDWNGPRPPRHSTAPRPRQPGAERVGTYRFMTEDRVRFILQRRDLGNAAAVRALGGGCSAEAVRKVRTGQICRELAADEPRWASPGGVTCHDCRLWEGRCAIGLPDPEEEGITFASECVSFVALSEAAAERRPAAGAD